MAFVNTVSYNRFNFKENIHRGIHKSIITYVYLTVYKRMQFLCEELKGQLLKAVVLHS